MKHTKLFHFLFTLTISIGLTGCTTSNLDINWEFSKEDAANAVSLAVTSTRVDGQEKKFLIAHYEPFLKEDLTKDDILFFNTDVAIDLLSSEDFKDDYLTIDAMKGCAIPYDRIINDSDHTRFTIVAPKDTGNKVGVLVKKEKTTFDKYIFSTVEDEVKPVGKTPQEEFEERYGRSTKAATLPFISNMLTGLTNIIAGGATTNPGILASGIAQVIGAILGGIAGIHEPTLRDVMEKLYEIEHRIKDLDAKVTENFSILRRDAELTKAYINQVLLNQYQQNTDTFETTFMQDIRQYNNTIADAAQKALRDVALEGIKNIVVPYFYNDKNVLSYRVLTEVSDHPGDQTVVINVPEFTLAKAKLKETKNIFTSDVMAEFKKDIYNATEGLKLPETLTRELLTDFAVNRLTQEFTRDYYTSHNQEALNYTNLVINLADRFNGISGQSILISYENRYKYMYNFGSEMRKAYNTITAQLRNFLEVNLIQALEACLWSGTNYQNMFTHYDSAIEAIKSSCETIDIQYPDNYAFIFSKKVTSALYSFHTDSYFTTKGNHPTHYNNFRMFRYDDAEVSKNTEVNAGTYDTVKVDDQYALLLRLKQLKDSRVLDSTLTYQHYLIYNKILSASSLLAIKDGIEKKQIRNNPNTFITEIKHRELTKDETGKVQCYFTDCGRGDMSYFKCNNYYGFRQGHDSDSWHATCWETQLVNGVTNTIDSNKTLIGLEGCYDEGHWYWRIDERYRFNDGPGHKFYCGISYTND